MFNRPVKQSFGVSPLNKYYASDIRYTFQMCQWLLKPIGMWLPIYGCATINEKIFSSLLIIVCLCLLCFVLFPAGHYLIFREKNMSEKLMVLGPVVYGLTSTIKYCYLGLKASAFGECIEHIETDWKMINDPRHRSIMLKNAAIGRYLTTMNIFVLYTGGLSYHILVPLLSINTIDNVTIRTLIYPGYDTFFDITGSPTYEIIFGCHCLYACIAYNIIIASCNLAAIFATHTSGQIQIQIERLESVVQLYRTQSPHSKDPLTIIVMDHIRILRLSGYVEDVLREILLMELLSGTLFLCLIEYSWIMEWTDSRTIAKLLSFTACFAALTLNLLIFCYIGQLLVDQGVKIGEACYAIEWYNLPWKKARCLLFVMMMSNFPPKLTAGKMFDLSFSTFSIILKSSFAYLNLIRAVT